MTLRVAMLGKYAQKPRVSCFALSCRDAGYEVMICEDSKKVEPENFDFAFTCGNHRSERGAFLRFERAKVPIVVLDLGYLNRASPENPGGFHQVGIGKIGWIPREVPGADRFEALGIDLLESQSPTSGPILLLGQFPGDSQHPFRAPRSMQWWLHNTLRYLVSDEEANSPTRREIIYRPHPLAKSDQKLQPFAKSWRWSDPKNQSIEEAISEASLVVTYNSTAGLEAIRQGIPAVCARAAHYVSVARGSRSERLAYFHRIAYAQWTLREIRDGTAMRYLQSIEEVPA